MKMFEARNKNDTPYHVEKVRELRKLFKGFLRKEVAGKDYAFPEVLSGFIQAMVEEAIKDSSGIDLDEMSGESAS